jgi:hypothetical protein
MKKTDSVPAERFVLLRLCAVAGLLSSTAFADSEFGYAVNTSDQGGFGAYLIEKSGLVVPQPYQLAPVDAGPPAAVSKGKFLIDMNTSFELDEYYLFCYRIQADGTLAYASQTYYPFPNGDPTAIAYLGLMHENGNYLYIVNIFAEGSSTQSTLTAMRIEANGSLNRVSSYGLDNGTQSIVGCRIDGDGVPEAIPGWSFPNDINVIAMALAPDRSYLYAFYQSVSPSGGSTEMLAVFKVGDQGNLIPVPGSPFRNDSGAGVYPYFIREDGMVTATPGTLLPSAASLSAFTHSDGGLGR